MNVLVAWLKNPNFLLSMLDQIKEFISLFKQKLWNKNLFGTQPFSPSKELDGISLWILSIIFFDTELCRLACNTFYSFYPTPPDSKHTSQTFCCECWCRMVSVSAHHSRTFESGLRLHSRGNHPSIHILSILIYLSHLFYPFHTPSTESTRATSSLCSSLSPWKSPSQSHSPSNENNPSRTRKLRKVDHSRPLPY